MLHDFFTIGVNGKTSGGFENYYSQWYPQHKMKIMISGYNESYWFSSVFTNSDMLGQTERSRFWFKFKVDPSRKTHR